MTKRLQAYQEIAVLCAVTEKTFQPPFTGSTKKNIVEVIWDMMM